MSCCRKIGELRCAFFDRHGVPAITIGPHWYLSWLLPVGSMPSIGLVMYLLFYLLDSKILQILGVGIIAFSYINFAITVLKNQGFEQPYSAWDLDKDSDEICVKWNAVRTNIRTIHCELWDVWVKEYDHHCPWMGKCIGEGNMRFFNLTIMGTGLFSLFFFVVIVYFVVTWTF